MCGPSDNTTPDASPFRQLGTIAYREQVATTAVGSVYRGYDRADGQPVMLKIGDPRRSELRLDNDDVARLAHHGIVRLREVGVTPQGEPVIVHDAPPSRCLVDAVSSYDGMYRQIAHLIRELALTLEHLHELGVTCGDISPRSVYIGEDDLPVLCEVGLGLITPATQRVADLEREGQDSAEARERKFKLDERADMFALGTVLYFLLTGKQATDQPIALMSDPHAPVDDITSIDVAAPEAPTELRAICAQALATDPVHRYLHAGSVVRDIDAYLYGKRSKPVVKIAFVVVGVALVALFGLWGTVGGGPARIVQADVMVHRADTPSGEVLALASADQSMSLADRFQVTARLSKRGYVSVYYRDALGKINTLYETPAKAEPQVEFALPTSVDAPASWWHPPPPGGMGLIIVVSHSEPRLPENLIAGVLAGIETPPRSYAALVMQGRYIDNATDGAALPSSVEGEGRSRKTWAEYSQQILKLLDGQCDDVVLGLVYVMGV